jgi:hypothetical protein
MTDELIVSDPAILGGKPCIRSTRLSVEFLLELVAGGATCEQILPSTRSSRPTASRQRFVTRRWCSRESTSGS